MGTGSSSGACPRCTTKLTSQSDGRLACEQCKGVWIRDLEFRELVRTMAPDLDPDVEIPFATRATATPMRCPICETELRPTRFGGVPLDRCDQDAGLWLDANELGETLHAIEVGYAERKVSEEGHITSLPHEAWQPEAEPDRVTVFDVFRQLFGKGKTPES